METVAEITGTIEKETGTEIEIVTITTTTVLHPVQDETDFIPVADLTISVM